MDESLPQKANFFHNKKYLIIAASALFVLILVALTLVLFLGNNSPKLKQNTIYKSSSPSSSVALPSLQYFKSHPTDQFLVDMDVVASGFPFKGSNSVTPHAGAHVHFGSDFQSWPRGGTAPSNYPKVYAVTDGQVQMTTYSFHVAPNDRYGLSLAIAKDGNTTWFFDYSIEPLIPEPSKDFYRPFLLVHDNQTVKKGQVLAYMYLPKGSTGAHIHFQLRRSDKQGFYAPDIFTSQIVQAFHDHWGEFGLDGGKQIPVCMGWKLNADENPFGTGAIDCLIN